MKINNNIGIAIATCGSVDRLGDLLGSFTLKTLSKVEIVVVNDGTKESIEWIYDQLKVLGDQVNIDVIQHDINKGVGVTKNDGLRHLLKNENIEHFFVIEDDIRIKDQFVFDQYIEVSKETGIKHFNYALHGLANIKYPSKDPNPRKVISYETCKIALYRHCVGAFSYFSRDLLEDIGLINEEYFNGCDHVEHTKRIADSGKYHPPFWWFADLPNSHELLSDIPWSIETSTISSNPKHREIMRKADEIFFKQYGHYPLQTPQSSIEDVLKTLKKLKPNG